MASDNGQILFIFSCRAGGQTPADSTLTNYIEQDTFRHVKENSGKFKTLEGKRLNFFLKATESLDCSYSYLNWQVPVHSIDLKKIRLSAKTCKGEEFFKDFKFPSDDELS